MFILSDIFQVSTSVDLPLIWKLLSAIFKSVSKWKVRAANPYCELSIIQYAYLVSLTVDRTPQLCRGEEHPQVVIQNRLLTNTAQSKVLQEPEEDQNTDISLQNGGSSHNFTNLTANFTVNTSTVQFYFTSQIINSYYLYLLHFCRIQLYKSTKPVLVFISAKTDHFQMGLNCKQGVTNFHKPCTEYLFWVQIFKNLNVCELNHFTGLEGKQTVNK